jgi:hypothetical protein
MVAANISAAGASAKGDSPNQGIAGFPANRAVPSDAVHTFPPMGKLIDIRERLLDAADLVIDFATLGEYGVEPEPIRDCERRPSGLASGAPHPLHDRAGEPERIAA